MSWNYSCPRCNARLNPRDSIILIAGHGDLRCLIGFHEQPGNYDIYLPPGVEPKGGDAWSFSCPVCQGSLQSKDKENFAELDLKVGEDKQRILFSRLAGEKATFIFTPDGLQEHHGVDAANHLQHVMSIKYMA